MKRTVVGSFIDPPARPLDRDCDLDVHPTRWNSTSRAADHIDQQPHR